MTSGLYRQNVGIALFNANGRVLIARRIKDDGPEIIMSGYEWQMPQGGVDPNEDMEAAARRELWEETGVVSAAVLGSLSEPVRYDFPPYSGPPHKLAAFRGQEQRWYAMRFTGDDSEIDLAIAGNDAEPEFDAWRWERLDRAAEIVVPYKRHIYAHVAREFTLWAGR
ncbi:RNA pyrophosphohydrolase [Enterovirga aerilata]|uniref:RNA pyrophosphohydrolase n=1 Tax=Enterovirga aerilata TaxID=2730920 RepID=A0A849HXH5_9HYPH|nr:RNA pyrophosphohydrolase [Enterovirga sp. DB1703]